eukprot:TRINITY_DN15681_c0_g1_i1.p1 TRINITY_DN15681_c0_g1~~TRINITY_DN15681_c0_g1_i1.p1  ORF type:complete len:237 (-),score=53.93 TRINITY_DN15681_c0_g1_i1:61-735(-)
MAATAPRVTTMTVVRLISTSSRSSKRLLPSTSVFASGHHINHSPCCPHSSSLTTQQCQQQRFTGSISKKSTLVYEQPKQSKRRKAYEPPQVTQRRVQEFQLHNLVKQFMHDEGEAWKQKKFAEGIMEAKARRQQSELRLEKAEKGQERQAYWNEFHRVEAEKKEGRRAKKMEYRETQERVLSDARKEWIEELDDLCHLWDKHPDQMANRRYRTFEGLKFLNRFN